MDANMEALVKKGQNGLLLLTELSQHAAILVEMGNQCTKEYLKKRGTSTLACVIWEPLLKSGAWPSGVISRAHERLG
jgi:hypothetical protein